MLVMIFDTETSGLPLTKFIRPELLDQWPYIVQLSYIIINTENRQIQKVEDMIICVPEGVTISNESSKIHGITQDISKKQGIPIEDAMEKFIHDFYTVSEIVGHNIEFDINLIHVESLRLLKKLNANIEPPKPFTRLYFRTDRNILKIRKFLDDFKKAKQYCTMKNSIDLCNIQKISNNGKPYKKFPKLEELHQHLFGTVPAHLHNALVDVFVCMHCYWKLKFNENHDFTD